MKYLSLLLICFVSSVEASGDRVSTIHISPQIINNTIYKDSCDVSGVSSAQVQHGYHTNRLQGSLAAATNGDCSALTLSLARKPHKGSPLYTGSVTVTEDKPVWGGSVNFNF